MNKIDFLKINNKEDNMVYSPYSIAIALCMLYEGANGETKKEIEEVLNNEEIYKYANIDKVFSVLNKLYIDNSIKNIVSHDFIENLSNKYNAELECAKLDVNIINNYVSEKTFGQIKNILDIITGNLILINTIALDMEWEQRVEQTSVHAGNFNEMEASYIYGFHKNFVSYYENNEILSLGINLKKYMNELDCVLIQPKNDSLSNYINKINDQDIIYVLDNLKSLKDDEREVKISVPKFSFDYNLEAVKTLKDLGFKSIVAPDLTRIVNEKNDLKIIHKSKIDFSEKGLKAASATIMEILCGCALPLEREKLIIRIDKPFLFIVRDKETNTILFMGKVYNPVLWQNDKENYKYN